MKKILFNITPMNFPLLEATKHFPFDSLDTMELTSVLYEDEHPLVEILPPLDELYTSHIRFIPGNASILERYSYELNTYGLHRWLLHMKFF